MDEHRANGSEPPGEVNGRPEPSPDDAPDLEQEVEELRQLAAERLEALQRLQAEFENYRKRMKRDRDADAVRARCAVVASFLPVIDHLELALESSAGTDPALENGLNLVLRQAREVLAAHGVCEIAPGGEQFDPAVAEPMMTVADESPAGTVTAVHRKGYRTEDHVLRPATVTVSRGPDESEQGGGDEDEQGSGD